MNSHIKFHPNQTMGKYVKTEENVMGRKPRWRGLGYYFEKIQASQMLSHNKLKWQISSKSDDGKVLKIWGEIGGGLRLSCWCGEPALQTKKTPTVRLHNFFSKMNFDTRFEITSWNLTSDDIKPDGRWFKILGVRIKARLNRNGVHMESMKYKKFP